jgi:hypothetical protein
MKTIGVVGLGFLGSLWVEEMCKRLYAFERTTVYNFLLIDFDRFERRNAANQGCTVSDEGMYKTDVAANRCALYQVDASTIPEKLTADNAREWLSKCALIVDAVDNLEARTEIWYAAGSLGIPVLHLGINQTGTGAVEWSWQKARVETWCLSPLVQAGSSVKPTKATAPETLPPCELVGFRGLGLNVAIAGAKAGAIWMGCDAEQHIGKTCPDGTMATFSADQMGHKLMSSELPVVEPEPAALPPVESKSTQKRKAAGKKKVNAKT